MDKAFYQLLSLAYKANKIQFGEKALEAIKNKQSSLVLFTNDISDKSLKRVLENCEFYNVKYLEIDDSTFVSKLLNKKIVKLISINDKGFAKSLKEKGGIEDGKK